MTEKEQGVLSDHARVKRKLVPPMLKHLGRRFFHYSWTRQLAPEAIWIGLVIDKFGYGRALEICREVVRAVSRAVRGSEYPMLARFSTFSLLTESQKSATIVALDDSIRHQFADALAELSRTMPSHPLAFLDVATSASSDQRLQKVLEEFYDRNSRLAVLSMAVAFDLAVTEGKLHIAPHLIPARDADAQVIADYPSSEASRAAASGFRASAFMLFGRPRLDGEGAEDSSDWVGKFWESIADTGPCVVEAFLDDETCEGEDELQQFYVGFRNAARSDLRSRLDNWPVRLDATDTYAVVTALLSRQATLVMEMAAPSMWTPHVAPILLRSIADVFISLAWILREPKTRVKLYVDDGLGAIKLQIAHQQKALETMTDADEVSQTKLTIEVWEDWLATQRISHLVEVNLGSWSGLNTRQMAKEAGFLDFYNYVYQPFSWVAHSTWAHISMHNTVHCQNPAHGLHHAPAILAFQPDLHWPFLAAKYLRKTFSLFDDTFGIEGLGHAAYEFIEAAMDGDLGDHGYEPMPPAAEGK